jgi:hypothetical protein
VIPGNHYLEINKMNSSTFIYLFIQQLHWINRYQVPELKFPCPQLFQPTQKIAGREISKMIKKKVSGLGVVASL